MSSIHRVIGLASVLFVLSACGGGGSSSGDSGTQPLPPATPTYSVTTSVAGSGSGSISPNSRTVSQGSTTSFTISPAAGSTVASVTGCGGSLSGTTYTTGAITSGCTVTATFNVTSYTVTATAGTGGSISPNSVSVAHGNTTTFTVTPNSGQEIASVTGCAGSLSGNTYNTGPITSACSVSASFRLAPTTPPPPATFTVTTSISGTGTGTITPGSATVTQGQTTSFTVTPGADAEIESVTGCGGSLSGNTYTTGPINANCQVAASFRAVVAPPPATFSVTTATSGNGTGSITPGSANVTAGQTASFQVTPGEGSSNTSVTGCGGTLSGNTYTTGPINANCQITATFSLNSYTVTATAGQGGSISPTSASIQHGSTATFSITPETGYSIGAVTGCGGSLNGTIYTTGPVTNACTVSASFAINTYEVTATAGTGGSISPTSVSVSHGDTTTFTVTPSSGQEIESVSGCVGTLSGNTYTTGPVTANCMVSALFMPQISVAINPIPSLWESESGWLDAQANQPGAISRYSWLQTSGPDVVIEAPDQATTSFVAPKVTEVTFLEFQLTWESVGGRVGIAKVATFVSPLQPLGGPIFEDMVIRAGAYKVESEISVAPDATLTIEPGVLLRFAPGTQLKVAGQLIAEGAPDSPIFFTCLRSCSAEIMTSFDPNSWQGIRLENDSSARFRHVIIEHANPAINPNWASPLVLEDSLLRSNACAVSSVFGTLEVRIERNTFHDSGCFSFRTGGTSLISENNISGIWSRVFGFQDNQGTVTIRDNNFFDPPEFEFIIIGGERIPTEIPFRMIEAPAASAIGFVEAIGNWWGTADQNKVNALIYDRNEDATLQEIPFIPFSEAPIENIGSLIPINIEPPRPPPP